MTDLRTSNLRGVAAVLALVLVLAGVGGCYNPFAPLIATSTSVYIPPPEPNSAVNVIRLFAWCWNNRDITRYQEIFSDDFRFVFALGDSAGNQFRDKPVDRAEELTIARNLFVGGGAEPPASSIVLTFDPTLRTQDDDRPGKNPRWHRQILTSVDLSIKTDQQEYRITGNARFYVVRGDSALIPKDLNALPDSTRWYIDQWNDETLQSPGGAVLAGGGAGAARGGPAALVTVSRVERVTGDAAGRRATRTDLVYSTQVTWGQLFAYYSR